MGRKYKGDFLISLLKVVTITLFCADYGNCTELPEATPTGNPLCTFSDNKNDNGSSFILVSAALDAYTLAKNDGFPEVKCASKDPMGLLYDGNLISMEVLTSRGYDANVWTNTLRIKINSSSEFAGNYTIYNLLIPSETTSFYLFEQTEELPYFMKIGEGDKEPILEATYENETGLILVPCKLRNAAASVSLHQITKEDGTEVPLENSIGNLTYDPRRGFTLNSSQVNINEDGDILFECQAKIPGNIDKIRILLRNALTKNGSNTFDKDKSKDTISSPGISVQFSRTDTETGSFTKEPFSGKCVDGKNESSGITLINIGISLSIQTHLHKECFLRFKRRCKPSTGQRRFSIEDDTNSMELPVTLFPSGLLICIQYEHRFTIMEYFIGLTHTQIYESWEAAHDDRALIRVTKARQNTNRNLDLVEKHEAGPNHTVFTCTFVKYFLVSPVLWSLGYLNGSKTEVIDSDVKFNEFSEGEYQLLVESESMKDLDQVSCSLLLWSWNSSVWLNDTLYLRDKSAARIKAIGDKPPFIISLKTEYTFKSETKNKGIYCEVQASSESGQTEIKWIAENNAMEADFESFRLTKNIQGLRFPVIDSIHSGYYTCIATNSYGSSAKVFLIKVVEDEASNFSLYGIFVFGTLVSLLAILIFAFCCGRFCFKPKEERKLSTITGRETEHGTFNGIEESTNPEPERPSCW